MLSKWIFFKKKRGVRDSAESKALALHAAVVAVALVQIWHCIWFLDHHQEQPLCKANCNPLSFQNNEIKGTMLILINKQKLQNPTICYMGYPGIIRTYGWGFFGWEKHPFFIAYFSLSKMWNFFVSVNRKKEKEGNIKKRRVEERKGREGGKKGRRERYYEGERWVLNNQETE